MPKTHATKAEAKKRQKLQVKSFSAADETRTFPHGHVELLNVPDGIIGRAVFEPGWRWSNDVKPIANTASCQVAHSIYVLSGRTHVRMDDGEELELGPGDYAYIPPGHDGWTVGDEACVALDMVGMAQYAKASPGARPGTEASASPH
jgi:mannose-6-phosphate isomerase-like protein (cupin superfamily)